MDVKRLCPASLEMLYNGMVIAHDIYSHSGDQLLIRKGNILNTGHIESIKRINGGKNTIYVTQETLKMLMSRNLGEKLREQKKLEQDTGYTDVKKEALSFLTKIEKKVENKTQSLQKEDFIAVSDKLSEQLHLMETDIIVDLINALAPVDEYLQRHCVNVSLLNGLMGRWMKLPRETVDTLVLIGLLHDCGKAALPHKIMSATRPLTVVEFEVVKMHTLYGYDMLSTFPETVRHGARAHHEKYNGKGYPDGIDGLNIPLFGRITAISDIYDAMTARRSYKEPKNPFFVLSLLKKLSDTELDPVLVKIFLENMPNELIEKPVVLSDGKIGVIVSIDPEDYEHPTVKVNNKTIKCNEKLTVKGMYYEGDEVNV